MPKHPSGLASVEYFSRDWELADTIEDAAENGTRPDYDRHLHSGYGNYLLHLVKTRPFVAADMRGAPKEIFEEVCQILEVNDANVHQFERFTGRDSLTCGFNQ